MPPGWAGGRKQPLVLHGGDNVGIATTAVFSILGIVEKVVTRGNNDCAHRLSNYFILLVILNCICGTYFCTYATFVFDQFDTKIGIN